MPDVQDAGSDRFYATVGSKVRSARIAAKLSQADLASQVGLTRSSVANLEAARQRTSLYHFVLISRVLKADVAELLPDVPKLSSEAHISPNVARELANSPESAQDFVRGAVAKLRDSERQDTQEQ
jgi:transcriptional regulator with XRE-family HTH domain